MLPNCTPKRRKEDQVPKSARILTSIESMELLVLKEKKKQEEQEEKERKKSERERKRLEREQEKARKQEEREAKKAERQRRMEEKENKKKTVGKRGRAGNASQSASQYKPSGPSTSSIQKQYPKRRAVNKSNHPVCRSTSGDTCAVCCGAYVDDVDDANADWIQCTNENCAVWSHEDCLDKEVGGFVCGVCSCVFN